jgi:type III secretion protein C
MTTLLPGWLAASCWCCLAGCIAVPAAAADIAWRPGRFNYVAQKKDLGELLREIGLSQGMAVSVAEGVQGTVSGRFDLTPRALLELMAATHDFVWYFDGSVLQISPSNSVRTEVLRLRYTNVDELQLALQRLRVADARYPLRSSTASTVVVSGPPGFVDLVQQVARSIDHPPDQRLGTELRVIPLRYAWAADREFDVQGSKQVVPGVATTLRSMFPRAKRAATARAATPDPGRLAAMHPVGGHESAGAIAQDDEAADGPDGGLPVIAADATTNAVLVRDLPALLPQYEAAIRKLDVEPAMLEIEARVIEVDSNETSTLGVDWHAASSHVDLQSGTSAMGWPLPPSQRNTGQAQAPLPGAVMTAVLGDAGRYLLARVNALSEDGKARITASPRVLTLNDQEAVMDQTQTFHVRVAGYQSAELYDISAGVTLRVTPLVVGDGGSARIKLDVHIQDGSLLDRTVDQIPVIQRSQISTQALVDDGEALLIGGYLQEDSSVADSGVPGLSKIPLLGALFRTRAKQSTRVERMFLLTPRILRPAMNRLSAPASAADGQIPGVTR